MLRFVAVIAVLLITVPAAAQDYNRNFDLLAAFNRLAPLQNPEYTEGSKLLDGKVIDSKNKVVGGVQDITIDRDGGINTLKVDFDRLRLGPPVFVNYRNLNVKPAGRGYALGMDNKQISSAYPSLLADIETASGTDDENFSLKKVLGSKVQSSDGRTLGTVEDVLFVAEGDRVSALYVDLTYGAMRGENIAVPLTSVKLENKVTGLVAEVPSEMADSIIGYIKEKNQR
ncbi:MAG: PRC-barrel domain-containing protein [Alphaproteobacteria bacterium]|nr:PRC-barrel domain-containing protein [Alphaproteobacteria bacterium]